MLITPKPHPFGEFTGNPGIYDKMEGSNLHNYIEKEFNLSEKIVGENIPSNDFIHKLDVKEFIKLLKVKMPFLDVYQLGILNKLAGDDLS